VWGDEAMTARGLLKREEKREEGKERRTMGGAIQIMVVGHSARLEEYREKGTRTGWLRKRRPQRQIVFLHASEMEKILQKLVVRGKNLFGKGGKESRFPARHR